MSIYAVKGNREERITEDLKEEYLSIGYDIIENGKRTISPSKNVSYAEYTKLYEENKKLKSENKKLKDDLKGLKDASNEAGA